MTHQNDYTLPGNLAEQLVKNGFGVKRAEALPQSMESLRAVRSPQGLPRIERGIYPERSGLKPELIQNKLKFYDNKKRTPDRKKQLYFTPRWR
jgi:hypothetical protein